MSYSSFQPLAYTVQTGSLTQLDTLNFDSKNYLRVILKISGTAGASAMQIKFNDSATGYSFRLANSFTPTAFTAQTTMGIADVVATTTDAKSAVIDIINFSGRPKTAVWQSTSGVESAGVAQVMFHGAGVWSGTSVITKISLLASGQVLNASSSIMVYGYD